MSFNLIRNSRVFFTTSLDTAGKVDTANLTSSNTQEIQVLDGFSFSQASGTETVTLNEAGATPIRGQRSYNTSLNPVDFSFSTYVRPEKGATNVDAEEGVLWNALFTKKDAADSWTPATGSASITPSNSNAHQLIAFGLIVVMDTTAFLIDNCVLTEASLDFGIDAISMIAWTGQAVGMRQVTAPTISAPTAGVVTLTAAGWFNDGDTDPAEATYKNVDADYIANKLSVAEIKAGIGGTGIAYPVAITGGNLTISNNVTFLTPANLGQVNEPITYFTGTRSVTGTLSAYLRTGSSDSKTSELITALLASASDDDTPYQVKIQAGGGGTSAPRIDLLMPACVVSIPDISTDQVVSTTINFTAQGSANSDFDITASNELTVTYYAVA